MIPVSSCKQSLARWPFCWVSFNITAEYPMNYAMFFIVLWFCTGYILSISFEVASLAMGQSYNCHNCRETTQMIWINAWNQNHWWYKHNKKHIYTFNHFIYHQMAQTKTPEVFRVSSYFNLIDIHIVLLLCRLATVLSLTWEYHTFILRRGPGSCTS